MIIDHEDVEAVLAAAEAAESEKDEDAKPEEVLSTVLDGANIPEDFRGKTIGDVFKMYSTSQQAAQMLSNQLRGAMTSPAPKPEEKKPPVEFSDSELGYGADPKQFEQKLMRLMEEKNAPLVQSFLQNAAQTTAMIAERDPNMPYFSKFRDQIYGWMSRATPMEQANIASWRLVYNNIVAQNIDALAEDVIARKQKKDLPPSAA